MKPPPLPYRPRTPSGHDIPIPESVFLALADIQQAVHHQGQQAQTWQANHDSEHRELGETVAKIAAGKRADWGKVIGLVAGAIVSIVGAVHVTTPTPAAPEVRAVKSLVEVRLEEQCYSLPAGSQARFECSQRIFSELEQSGRR